MAIQTTFKRYEVKYLLTKGQKEAVLAAMAPYMALDQYGRTTIRNIYYDTDKYRLARRSIERPAYKEKLRVRSYGPAGEEDRVFVELKKKYDGVVYKRRLTMKNADASAWLNEAGTGALRKPDRQVSGIIQEPNSRINGLFKESDRQIAREIEYFRDFYGTLRPAAFLSYEREAYYARAGGDFRVTFDENIMARTDRLSLGLDAEGEKLIPPGMTLMEIKCAGGYPLWMVKVLSEQKCYKTSFSKYGTAYQTMILPTIWNVSAASLDVRENAADRVQPQLCLFPATVFSRAV